MDEYLELHLELRKLRNEYKENPTKELGTKIHLIHNKMREIENNCMYMLAMSGGKKGT